MRVVLDTNILMSGLMHPASTPGRIIAAWSEAQFDVVSSHEQLAEIGRVLGYPKIRRILQWDEQRIEHFIKQLYVRVEVVEPESADVEALRDPDDAPILGALTAAGRGPPRHRRSRSACLERPLSDRDPRGVRAPNLIRHGSPQARSRPFGMTSYPGSSGSSSIIAVGRHGRGLGLGCRSSGASDASFSGAGVRTDRVDSLELSPRTNRVRTPTTNSPSTSPVAPA